MRTANADLVNKSSVPQYHYNVDLKYNSTRKKIEHNKANMIKISFSA